MASSRDLRRWRLVKRDRLAAILSAQAHHLNGGRGGLKALVAGLDARAVQRLLQSFAGEHAEAVGNAGLLLRLADAAGHFVVDGLVVGGFAAQQAAQRHDRVHTASIGAVRAARGISHAPGTRTTSNIGCGRRRCA